MHFNGFGPVIAVETAREAQPVRAGVRGVAAAELLAIGQPQAPLAVESETRIGIARRSLEFLCVLRDARHRRLDLRGRQLRDGLHEFAVFEADDADGATAVERLTALDEGAVIVAPFLRAFFVGDPQPAPGIAGQGGTGLEPSGFKGNSAPGSALRIDSDVIIARVSIAIVVGDPISSIRAGG